MSKDQKTRIVIAGPDFEEGPHSNMKEEQFFDAIDNSLDTLELAEDARFQAFKSLTQIPELEKVPQHRLSDEIEKIVQDHLKYDLQDDLNSNVWELLCSDGEMKIYRRELEENGLVLDPLKAVHTVKVYNLTSDALNNRLKLEGSQKQISCVKNQILCQMVPSIKNLAHFWLNFEI